MVGKEPDRGLHLLGIDKILDTAGEQGDLDAGFGPLVRQFRPAVAESLVGHGRQGLEIMLLEKHHRQVPHEAVIAGHRFLRPLGGAQEGMEEFAVFHNLTEQQAGQRVAGLVLDAHMHLFDQTRQVDAAGADILAGLAVDAVLHQVFGLFRTMEEIGFVEETELAMAMEMALRM